MDKTLKIKKYYYCDPNEMQFNFPLIQKRLWVGMSLFYNAGLNLSTKLCNAENEPEDFWTNVLEPNFEKLFPEVPTMNDSCNPANLLRLVAKQMFITGWETSDNDFNGETLNLEKNTHDSQELFAAYFRFMIGVNEEELENNKIE